MQDEEGSLFQYNHAVLSRYANWPIKLSLALSLPKIV